MLPVVFIIHLIWRVFSVGSASRCAILSVRCLTFFSVAMLIMAATVSDIEQALFQERMISKSYTLAVLSVNVSLEVVLQAYRRFVLITIGQACVMFFENVGKALRSPAFYQLCCLLSVCYVLSSVRQVVENSNFFEILPLVTQVYSYAVSTTIIYYMSSNLWYYQSSSWTPLISLSFAYNFSTNSRGELTQRMINYWLSTTHPAARSTACALFSISLTEAVVVLENLVDKITKREKLSADHNEDQKISSDLWREVLLKDEKRKKALFT